MEKEFVNYDLSLRMKTLGFNEPCFGYYLETKEWTPASYSREGTVYPSNSNLLSDWVAAPTFSQTFRWFRDKYNLDSCLKPEIISGKKSYDFYIWIDNNEDLEFGVTKISTYEEAELICLEKLIEIVEQKEK
jgi:hypothetical protein